jgi:N-acetyl-anhydromuramyl-L-alanine amidase AmpD
MTTHPLGPVRFLTIHCAATPEGRDVKAATIDQWDVAKFGQVSYHWIVELDGTTVRGLADDVRGAHVGGKNSGNIGICYVGGMDRQLKAAKDTRTPAQRAALLQLARSYRQRFPQIIIRGHRDWPGVKKDCPSFDVADWLGKEGVE